MTISGCAIASGSVDILTDILASCPALQSFCIDDIGDNVNIDEMVMRLAREAASGLFPALNEVTLEKSTDRSSAVISPETYDEMRSRFTTAGVKFKSGQDSDSEMANTSGDGIGDEASWSETD